MRKSRIFCLSLLASGYWLVAASPVHAQTLEWASINSKCVGATATGTTDVATLQGFECLFYNILSVALRLIGLAMFLMLLFGGFKYLTSGGDPKAVEAAKATLTTAVTGLVLAVLAWFILSFISKFTGIGNLLFFQLGI